MNAENHFMNEIQPRFELEAWRKLYSIDMRI